MVQFGFSIYPENYSLEESKAYIDLLGRYGARRMFMSLLQLGGNTQEALQLYRDLIAYARQLGIVVIADLSPSFIEAQGWQKSLIEEAHGLGLTGIRLDESLPLEEIVSLTQNPYGLKIELNLSTDKVLLTQLLASEANRDNIVACHNFYPHAYTGLSEEHFFEMSSFYYQEGIQTAAFVTAQSATEGPWLLSEGLPTLEEHRNQTLPLQIAWLKATGLIDCILISNQFISEEELQSIQSILKEEDICLPVDLTGQVTAVEREIIEFDHVYRGDISAYLLRSTMPRVVYKDATIPAHTDRETLVQRGDVLIDNDLYGRYKGELQIALREFTVSSKVNRVGRICPDYLPLLAFIKPWQSFRLRIVASDSFH
ncbi:DUF871 domain-containing protein [Streptococcus suis]|uniref:Uncharacterized protein n=2 Tax=Streptococcus suis TaxID=1307 RepID=A0AA87K4M8_STRSU|nr:MupG family TIM beta-alpha barrel fold protein [Streptococcus suis]EHC03677.1 protein of unknown function DUF871 [Streptococcus suis R61]MBY5001662.1 MupG family TIM beta-alpha barrel fold protein [Streptococcus suis]MBY5012797.1 MupG family TIM beta-alpha barrel fold protein [Streptococcus suis]MBY5019536.1 MupG family TIM beta-alpha barrel fold protein [Streptococcus suis]